jgi:hypothetical protein
MANEPTSHVTTRRLTKSWEFGQRMLYGYNFAEDRFFERSSRSLLIADESFGTDIERFFSHHIENPHHPRLRWDPSPQILPTRASIHRARWYASLLVGSNGSPANPYVSESLPASTFLVPNASYARWSMVVPVSSVRTRTDPSPSLCTNLVLHVPAVAPGRMTARSSSP